MLLIAQIALWGHSFYRVTTCPAETENELKSQTDMRKLFLLTLCLPIVSFASIIPGGSCENATLADYIALGTSGCYAQSGVFLDNFSYSETGTVDATDVDVVFVYDIPGDTTLTAFYVAGPWIATNGGSLSVHVGWDWSGTDFVADYEISSGEGKTFSTGPNAGLFDVALTTPCAFNSSSTSTLGFGVGCIGNINVDAAGDVTTGPGGSANIAGVSSQYIFVAPVPEPGTTALLGLGLSALIAARMRRQSSIS